VILGSSLGRIIPTFGPTAQVLVVDAYRTGYLSLLLELSQPLGVPVGVIADGHLAPIRVRQEHEGSLYAPSAMTVYTLDEERVVLALLFEHPDFPGLQDYPGLPGPGWEIYDDISAWLPGLVWPQAGQWYASNELVYAEWDMDRSVLVTFEFPVQIKADRPAADSRLTFQTNQGEIHPTGVTQVSSTSVNYELPAAPMTVEEIAYGDSWGQTDFVETVDHQRRFRVPNIVTVWW